MAEATSNIVALTIAKKRGRKVRRGPIADILPMPDSDARSLYARLCACKFNPEDQEAAYEDQLAFAKRFWPNGELTHTRVREMIANRRARLEAELDRLSDLVDR